MKAIIIEDERIATDILIGLLREVAPEMDVIAQLQSVDESIAWINSHPLPDLAFVDIHLADGSSFAIFEECAFNCPIIFTTAYDQYAIKAFEVNSIGYLLKPIDKEKLRKAIEKIPFEKNIQNQGIIDQLLTSLRAIECPYRQNILVAQQDKLIPIPVAHIAYFTIDGRQVIAVNTSGKSLRVDMILDELQTQLNPRQFFRVNRQYIVQHAAVRELTQWFLGKYVLGLTVETPEKIIIPKARISTLKEWLAMSGE